VWGLQYSDLFEAVTLHLAIGDKEKEVTGHVTDKEAKDHAPNDKGPENTLRRATKGQKTQ